MLGSLLTLLLLVAECGWAGPSYSMDCPGIRSSTPHGSDDVQRGIYSHPGEPGVVIVWHYRGCIILFSLIKPYLTFCVFFAAFEFCCVGVVKGVI